MQVYLTREGEVVDWIVWRHYGRQDQRLVETVLEANRGLAGYGTHLPAGVEIVLPDPPATTRQDGVRLWS